MQSERREPDANENPYSRVRLNRENTKLRAEITRLAEALRAAEEREKALVRLVERAQVNTPDQYVNWHEHARQALAGAKP